MNRLALLQQQHGGGRAVAAPAPVAVNAWQFWSPETISAILHAPIENVRAQWPLVFSELAALDMADRPVCSVALATIGVESGTFLPVQEAWWLAEDARRAYLERMYGYTTDIGRQLGNIEPGDGWRYGGTGLVQLSGRSNFRTYGQKIGIDLEASPERALEPAVSAKTLAVYFRDHRALDGTNMADAARAGLWRLSRILVNGGTNGLADYLGYINALQAHA